MPEIKRLELISQFSDEDLEKLYYDWKFWARKNQLLPPGNDWAYWRLIAGRGFGKTRTGAETIRQWVEESTNPIRIALVGATAADARDVMVEGESGLLACSPPWLYPIFEPSKRRLTWPNKCRATLYSADEPGRLRGPQHHKAWADEAAVWQYEEAWDNLMFGLRLGDHPQCVVTTTPKRTKIVKALMALENAITTAGTTYDNIENLATAFIETIIKKYEGTTLGKQELLGKLVEDVDGALWNHKLIDDLRINRMPQLSRIVVAVDPSGSSVKTAAECGIVTAGIGKCRCKGKEEMHGFVFDDRSLRASPNGWAKVVLRSYYTHKADRVIAEVNYGGEMVENTIRTVDKNVSYKAVSATHGKQVRAEPVAALYEQGKVHHVGSFAYLEDEMCTWVPGDKSPNRMDALVWALTDLMLKNSGISVEVL